MWRHGERGWNRWGRTFSYLSPLIASSSPHAAWVRACTHHEAPRPSRRHGRPSVHNISATGNCDGLMDRYHIAPRRSLHTILSRRGNTVLVSLGSAFSKFNVVGDGSCRF